MSALAIVGTTIAGLVIGGIVGIYVGEREDRGSDFSFAPIFYGPMGAAIGAVLGTIVGSVLFA